MKKITIMIVQLCAFYTVVNAQGLFGLGSPSLSKKKIEKISMVLANHEHISPGSAIKINAVATDKKQREFKTKALGGDYYFNYNYTVSVENGYYDPEAQAVKVSPLNKINGEDVKIVLTLKGVEKQIVDEKNIKIDYLGEAVIDFSGKSGKPGYTASTKWTNDGSNGEHGGNNATPGEHGKEIICYAKIIKEKGDDFVKIKVIDNQTKSEDLYKVKLNTPIIIDVSGGKGGEGGSAASGTSGNKDRYINGGKGGDGGDGANGGDRGSITMYLDNSMKGKEAAIKYLYLEGFGGNGGRGGNGGQGYKNGDTGRSGRSGQNGRSGKHTITYKEVKEI